MAVVGVLNTMITAELPPDADMRMVQGRMVDWNQYIADRGFGMAASVYIPQCTCTIQQLVTAGCNCGAFQAEQEQKEQDDAA